MSVRNVPLKEFLKRAQVPSTSKLPWVHTTQAHRALDVIADQRIMTSPCDVFRGEELCYLFVGRPAYKYQVEEGETPDYLLPAVFVCRFQDAPPIKRMFPFDSGAFMKRFLPGYVTTFEANMFELEPERASIGTMIGTFFGSDKAYMKRQAKGSEELKEQHSIMPSEAPVKAIGRLYADKGSDRFDDRAAAIELQLESPIDLTKQNLLGVVLPEEYKREKNFIEDIHKLTQNVEYYGIHPMNVSMYWALISECVDKIYKKSGIML